MWDIMRFFIFLSINEMSLLMGLHEGCYEFFTIKETPLLIGLHEGFVYVLDHISNILLAKDTWLVSVRRLP